MEKKILKGIELNKRLGLGGQLASKTTKSLEGAFAAKSGVISKAELSAKEKGSVLMEEAQKEALRIKAEAERLLSQVEEARDQARKEGYQEGKEEGVAEWTGEILKVKELKERFFAQAEPEMIKLVMSIAEKVIGKLVAEHKEAIRSIVRQALERSLGDKIVVRMNPQDLKRLQTEEMLFKDLLDRTKQLHFKEDTSIQKGGCVIETEIGTIDAQLETQLKAIRKALGV